jgi:hypothetical protein
MLLFSVGERNNAGKNLKLYREKKAPSNTNITFQCLFSWYKAVWPKNSSNRTAFHNKYVASKSNNLFAVRDNTQNTAHGADLQNAYRRGTTGGRTSRRACGWVHLVEPGNGNIHWYHASTPHARGSPGAVLSGDS